MTNYIKYEVKVYADGSKYWYLNGKLHREDGPAIEYSDGYKAWYLNGKLHREDGPAVEYSNGDKFWYLNGQLLTEKEFNERMTPTVEMTMAQINEALGKNVKVVK
jgi:antitoxin component YwqK of YwqJK toxin-antitoxin module